MNIQHIAAKLHHNVHHVVCKAHKRLDGLHRPMALAYYIFCTGALDVLHRIAACVLALMIISAMVAEFFGEEEISTEVADIAEDMTEGM